MHAKCTPHPHRVSAALREYDSGGERSHILRPVYSGSTTHKYEFCWCEKAALHIKNEVGTTSSAHAHMQ